MTDEYGLKSIHEAELYMLKELDRVCKENNIKYALDAGTLIGAVREGGFIPWDDDVDVVMTRDNWMRFREVAKDSFREDIILQEPPYFAKEEKFYDFVNRLLYVPSQRHDEDARSQFFNEILNHLWIDIFVLDSIPDGKFHSFIAVNGQKLIYALAMGHKRADFRDCTAAQSALITPFAFIGKHISMNTILRWKEALSVAYNNSNARDYYYTNYPPDWFWLRVRKEMEDIIDYVPFEDTQLPIPHGYDEILRLGYGDYMKRPDPENRRPEHGTDMEKQQHE